jgi:putative transposase
VKIHADARETYGTRRVHAELTLGHGLTVGHEQVTLLMRRAGIQGLSGRPAWRRAPKLATAADLVDRRFVRTARDQLWVTDITEHPTREGKVYCAVVLDVYSRRVVGWSIDAAQTAVLVTNALGMAIDSRTPNGGTLIHSDHGVQFTSWAFTRRALDSGLVPSMGSIGDCCDNAVIESFWSRMQVELLDRKRWKTRSNSPTRSSSTSRSSTTVSAATQRSACSPPSSSKLDTPAAQQRENPTKRLHPTRGTPESPLNPARFTER